MNYFTNGKNCEIQPLSNVQISFEEGFRVRNMFPGSGSSFLKWWTDSDPVPDPGYIFWPELNFFQLCPHLFLCNFEKKITNSIKNIIVYLNYFNSYSFSFKYLILLYYYIIKNLIENNIFERKKIKIKKKNNLNIVNVI